MPGNTQFEQSPMAGHRVVDPGKPQAVPHHRLVADNDRLAEFVFDLLHHIERAQGAAANEYRVGIGLVGSPREFGDRGGSYAIDIAVARQIHAPIVGYGKPVPGKKAPDHRVHLVMIGRRNADRSHADGIERANHTRHHRSRRPRTAAARGERIDNFGFADNHRAAVAGVAGDIQPIFGQGIVRILVISPFFVMPPVAALVWKNMIMHPGYGIFADISRSLGLQPVDWFASYPLFSIVIIVAWQWLPFATLILLTALQSLDGEQKEAAEMDGAGPVSRFIYLTLPHMSRAITVVILIQTIFLLAVYAEILVTTNGGPGYASTNLPFLIYRTALLGYDVGGASAGGIIAVVLANIVALFLMRAVGKNLDR